MSKRLSDRMLETESQIERYQSDVYYHNGVIAARRAEMHGENPVVALIEYFEAVCGARKRVEDELIKVMKIGPQPMIIVKQPEADR